MQGLQCRNTVVPMLNDAVSHPAAPVAPTHVAPVVGRYRRPWLFFALAFMGQATMWMAVFADVGTALIVVANGLRAMRK